MMAFLLLLSPLVGFLINASRFKRAKSSLSGWIASGACLISFLISVYYFLQAQTVTFSFGSWISIEDFQVSFSFILDPLTLLMLLLITGVGFLIHVYSMNYMAKDGAKTRYFAYLNLFVFMMLLLVLADNLLVLFVGWEGVGLCSYLLIGFWFKDIQKARAGMKAFIVNRVGDTFFLLGLFLVFSQYGTLNFSELNAIFFSKDEFQNFFSLGSLGALCLFLGATGKSAQAPLHIWLADAMAGPTPVSALIHAATMVTAGIYMVVRLFGMYFYTPDVLTIISWVGAITALGAALVATRQWDFKKVLAYSTISQLGYMFMSLGVKAFSTGVFHLLTHGFFKSLLFLCAGSVIHGLSGEQDIRSMGGLRKYFPNTFWCYMVGTLSLIALPPFSGFFSKDEILHSLFASGSYGLYGVALITAFCTCFYMTRLTTLVFFGKQNFKGKAHEGGGLMIMSLWLLALLALFGGLLGVPHIFSELLPYHLPHFLKGFLSPFVLVEFKTSYLVESLLMALSVGGSLIMMICTFFYYRFKKSKKQKHGFWKDLLENSFYTDSFLEKKISKPFFQISEICFETIDKELFQKGILWISDQVLSLRKEVSYWVNGNLQSYALYFVMGLAFFVVLVFLK
ncbi:MAG: NADH-quinone oxidoreductase subunit L [Bdellovibrionales bacterium]